MSDDAFLEGLTLTDAQRAALAADGITAPTSVQQGAIGPILAGQDAVLHSGTGTGKTLAYLLPVLQKLREGTGRAVVIAPGVELAMQCLRVAKAYLDPEMTAAAAVSTSSSKRQRKRVQKSTQLVVGTPDRILELFGTGKLKGTEILVLDELDPILASRGAAELETLLSRSEPVYQKIVATATLSKRSEAFVSRFLPGAVRIEGSTAPLREDIDHFVLVVPRGAAKELTLARFIQNHSVRQAIVFASEARQQGHIYRFLTESNIATVTVSRDRSKQERQRGLDAFRRGEARVLITTDAAGRGLDVPDVKWVLHYDVPRSPQAYVHRSGRTGRAGKRGTSVLLVDDASRPSARRLERQLGLEFRKMPKK